MSYTDMKYYLLVIFIFNIFPLFLTQDIDCNGRSFYCSSKETFRICFENSPGVMVADTVDNNCPPNTECLNSGQFECELFKSPITTNKVPTTTRSPINNGPACKNNVIYPDRKSCHNYFLCINGKITKLYCPFNMVYNQITGQCSFKRTDCQSTIQCQSEGYFPDPKSCQCYFRCIKSGNSLRPSRKYCPLSQSFNEVTKKCVDGPSRCPFIENYFKELTGRS